MENASYPAYVRLTLFLLGLSFYWFRTLHTIFNAPVLHANVDYVATFTWFFAVAANTFALIAAFTFAKRLSPFAKRNVIVWSAVILASLGILLVNIGLSNSGLSVLSYAGAIMTSTGCAILPMLWREASEVIVYKSTQRALFASAVVIGMSLYLLSISIPRPLTVLLSCLSPIISALLLQKSSFSSNQRVSLKVLSSEKQSSLESKFVLPYPLFFCCFAFALSQGVCRTNFLPIPDGIDSSWSLLISGAILLIVLFVLISFLLSKKSKFALLNELFLPLVNVIALVMPYFLFRDVISTNFFVFLGHLLFLICIYAWIDDSVSSRYLATQVTALCIISINIGLATGASLGLLLEGIIPTWSMGIIILVFCLSALASRALLNDRIASRFSSFQIPENVEISVDGQLYQNSLFDIRDSVRKHCSSAAKKYSLSTREEEILEYLVRGRSAKSIASEEHITYNTVKTHMSHIYLKLGVHTREELIRIVEAIND